MIAWLTGTFAGKVFMTFLVSMVPIIELRGGIPWGVAHDLPIWLSYSVAVLGNMVPVPIILIFLRKVFQWLKTFDKSKNMVERLESRAHLKGQKVQKYRALGLFILVAIPLPGTGAWTGALVASVLSITPKKAFPIIFLGVMTAGVLMMLLSHGVKALL